MDNVLDNQMEKIPQEYGPTPLFSIPLTPLNSHALIHHVYISSLSLSFIQNYNYYLLFFVFTPYTLTYI